MCCVHVHMRVCACCKCILCTCAQVHVCLCMCLVCVHGCAVYGCLACVCMCACRHMWVGWRWVSCPQSRFLLWRRPPVATEKIAPQSTAPPSLTFTAVPLVIFPGRPTLESFPLSYRDMWKFLGKCLTWGFKSWDADMSGHRNHVLARFLRARSRPGWCRPQQTATLWGSRHPGSSCRRPESRGQAGGATGPREDPSCFFQLLGARCPWPVALSPSLLPPSAPPQKNTCHWTRATAVRGGLTSR